MTLRRFIYLVASAHFLLPLFLPAQERTSTITVQNEQEKDEHQRLVLLTSARSRYYNLVALGVKSIDCDVDIDWNVFLTSVTGHPLSDSDPFLAYLRATRVHFEDPLNGLPKLDWANPNVPPAGKEQAAATLRNSYTAMLTGFLQVWAPSQNGSLITLRPESVKETETGFLISRSKDGSSDRTSMDKMFLITHISSISPDITSEADTTFVPAAGGLLLSTMDDTYSQPPGAPGIRFILATTYAPLQTYFVPEILTITFPNAGIFKMKFVSCSVQKQP